MKIPLKERIGSFLAGIQRMETPVNELRQKANFSSTLLELMASKPFIHGYMVVVEARKDELVRQIRIPTNKDKYEELSIRLDEIDRIMGKIEQAIEEGQKAHLQLETINDTQKETA